MSYDDHVKNISEIQKHANTNDRTSNVHSIIVSENYENNYRFKISRSFRALSFWGDSVFRNLETSSQIRVGYLSHDTCIDARLSWQFPA
jgi:hypothetical protein